MSSHANCGMKEKSDVVPFRARGDTMSLGESRLDVLRDVFAPGFPSLLLTVSS